MRYGYDLFPHHPFQFNPYSLQAHAQQSVVSPHNEMRSYGASDAPMVNRRAMNPSRPIGRNIMRDIYAYSPLKGF